MAANDSLILAENDACIVAVAPTRPIRRSALTPELEGHLAEAAHGPAAAIETPLLSSDRPQSGAALSRSTRPPNRLGR